MVNFSKLFVAKHAYFKFTSRAFLLQACIFAGN